jgi:hypothetical protein
VPCWCLSHFWTPNVPCWQYLLGYTLHHSVCDTVLLPTPRVDITVSFTLSTDPLMSCLGAIPWCLNLSKAGCWLTSRCRLYFATGSVTCQLFVFVDCLRLVRAAEIQVLKRTYTDRKQDTSLYSSDTSIATSWLLRRCPTCNGIRCHGNICSASTMRRSGFIHQLLHSSVNNRLPSRFLGMDVH